MDLELAAKDFPPHDRPFLSVLIPALNECGRIGKVLQVLASVDHVDQIIIVDDGSTDGMVAEIKRAAEVDSRIRLIQNPVNLGKGQSLFIAWRSTNASKILMLDADLINLTPEHVNSLVEPVLAGKADMTIGIFRGGKFATDFSHWFTPWLSGQRCLSSEMFNCVSESASSGYGFETALSVAAQKQDWKVQKVILQGVSHPPSEIHRGFFQGLAYRSRMYAQIVRSWKKARRTPAVQGEGEPQKPKKKWARILFSILTLFFAAGLLYNDRMVSGGYSTKVLPLLSLNGVQRVLVIAPHPDDETLGSGGLIQAALAQGSEVRVALMTNGDGQFFAPLAMGNNALPAPSEYVYIGKERQAESLAALKELGVSPSKVYFLGYPDGGTYPLWISDWTKQCPMRARFTGSTSSPYAITFDPQAEYCGSFVLKDLMNIIQDYRPDLITVTHPNDQHPDHRAAFNFAAMAISMVHGQDPSYQPEFLGYLIHYGKYPQPRGLDLQQELLPPLALSRAGDTWVRLALSQPQESQKRAALLAYSTQQKLLGKFMLSFVRTDEIYRVLPSVEMGELALYQEPVGEMGMLSTPGMSEPVQENTPRILLAGSDLISWQAHRLGNSVWILFEARGKLLPELTYRIQIKTPDGRTRTIDCSNPANHWSPTIFFTRIDLQEYGTPPVIGFSAETAQKVVLDHTAWHFLIFR